MGTGVISGRYLSTIKNKSMNKILLIIWLGSSSGLLAQKYDAYKDDYLGWIKIYGFKGAAKTTVLENKKYTIPQLSLIDTFANWMQSSYKPKGCLGDIIKYISPKTGIYNEAPYNKALPHSYGARAPIYIFLKQSGGKWMPENNLGYNWTIAANEIPLSYRYQDLETGKTPYFTLPGLSEHDTDDRKLYGLDNHPVISRYIHHLSPKYGNIQRINHVILSKNNIHPFVQLTVGEALQLVEEILPIKLKEEIDNIKGNNIGRPEEIQRLSGYQQQNFARCKETLDLMKEKYRNRLGEPAYCDMSILSDLRNGYDFFTNQKVNEGGNIDKTIPLLRIRPDMEALCKTDKPQWIMIKWFGGAMNEEQFKHMHESILNNFDFDYLYNFIFDPLKNQGRPYQPKRSPAFEEKGVLLEKSETAKQMVTDASVFFFDDFSGTAENMFPAGWNSNLNSEGQKPRIKKEGNTSWLQLRGQTLHINKLSKNLPQQFEVSFDVFVKKGFHWGSTGLEFRLAGNEKYKGSSYGNEIMVKIRPGFDDRDGWATVYIKAPPKSANPPELAVPGFSNNQLLNKTRVTIRKTGTQLQVWVGNTKVFDQTDALPANLILNHFFFTEYFRGWEEEDYYISNFKISII